jgi:L,D-peptidoglycan transpeptidase YkuD (ErfK/YbiS/YcfS/YnhG family)
VLINLFVATWVFQEFIYLTTYACDEDCEYYNQIIDTEETGHECKGEEMFSYQPQYNYGIATDFNKACIYPNGSAIFIPVNQQ